MLYVVPLVVRVSNQLNYDESRLQTPLFHREHFAAQVYHAIEQPIDFNATSRSSNHIILVMSFTRLLVAPTLATAGLATHAHYRPRTLHCEVAAPSLSGRTGATQPLIDPHQFATGSVLGIAAGLLLKRLGKFFFLLVGGSYIVLRALGTTTVPGIGQLRIPWRQARQFVLNKSPLGDATSKAGQVGESPIVTFLTKDLTFKVSFLATFMIGLVNT